jgi:2-C-methyl-D-erythritol 4-phosphate cytidylyltransferase/2-C-methyl-D-erythritol 2,4-cyclodiphosphate synthase
VVVAAGQGQRFGSKPKLLSLLAGRPVLWWALKALKESPKIQETILVVPPGQKETFASKLSLDWAVTMVEGGAYRAQSVAEGFLASSPTAEIILVHDGARPLTTPAQISQTIELAERYGAAILAIPVRDTLKRVSQDGVINHTVERANLWQAQTPQAFKKPLLEMALKLSLKHPEVATDEAISLERLGHLVRIAEGSPRNLKITFPEDLAMAESLMSESALERNSIDRLRVGQGWDFHRFDPERPLWLGCVLLEGQPGLLGHSDADVLAHALIDALLGAAGLGDIGVLFPPEDEKWRGASGSYLLGLTAQAFQEAGFQLINADLTLIGQSPRVAPQRAAMILAMAKALGVKPSQLSLKATTTEKMGFVGRGEGLAAGATVLAQKTTI